MIITRICLIIALASLGVMSLIIIFGRTLELLAEIGN